MGEYATDVLVGHLADALWAIIERGNNGEDGGSGIRCELHVAQVDAIERGFADAEEQWAVFFQGDVGRALNEIGGEAVGDRSERSHGAGKDDHRSGGITAAGDVGSDIRVGLLMDLG